MRVLIQMDQVRTSRGYKHASPACKAAVVAGVSASKKLKTVGVFLAAKALLHEDVPNYDPHHEDEYRKLERYAYWLAGL